MTSKLSEYTKEAQEIISEAQTQGGFAYAHNDFDCVSVGYNADTEEFFVADNGLIEIETTDADEFLQWFPSVMLELWFELWEEQD